LIGSIHLRSSYIDAAHILPNLFPFTTPAKFCVRAIVSFIRFVTHSPPTPKTILMPRTPTSASSGSILVADNSSSSSSESGSDGLLADPEPKHYRMVASLSTRLRGWSGAQIFRFGNEEVWSSSSSHSGNDSRFREQPKDPPAPVVFAGGGAVYDQWVSA